jgi:uncharacterized membrane protein YkvA (DUF1232 family)
MKAGMEKSNSSGGRKTSKLLWEKIKQGSQVLNNQVYALYFASRDKRTPWYAKALAILVVAYAVSPIDLVPDFIPVVGYLDDLILIPAGVALTLKLIPPEVMAEAVERAQKAEAFGGTSKWIGILIIVMVWIIGLGILALIVVELVKMFRNH